ncbi:MAG: helix-turn-helix transcriptional regulator [Hyphomonadaceae bacterium]
MLKRGTSIEAQLQQHRARMMHLYFDQGWSLGAVAKAQGRSPALVAKYVREEQRRGRRRTRTGASRDLRKRENRRPLSPMHALIGVRLLAHRVRRGWSMTECGLHIRQSRFRVGQLESGTYDITLRELDVLARELDVPMRDLASSDGTYHSKRMDGQGTFR